MLPDGHWYPIGHCAVGIESLVALQKYPAGQFDGVVEPAGQTEPRGQEYVPPLQYRPGAQAVRV